MSENARQQVPVALQFDGVSKVFYRSRSPLEKILRSGGGRRLAEKFWGVLPSFAALDDISLKISQGERLGIVGRNGAGKTTLLKIATGVLAPSAGKVVRSGTVAALMNIGAGFHSELTGRQNMRAALVLQNLTAEERRSAEDDIIEFCELGDFIDQPFRSYSLGMKSRLQFACATSFRPEVIVIDEILGAGDGYFAGKSANRIADLANSGCAMIVVSHAMGQILQFCERVAWIEAGKLVAEGPAQEIVTRYEHFLAELRREAQLEQVDSLDLKSNWLQERARRSLARAQSAKVIDRDIDPDATIANRWITPNSPLAIKGGSLVDGTGKSCAAFSAESSMMLQLSVVANRDGVFPCIFGVVVYSDLGHLVCRLVSPKYSYDLKAGEVRTVQLTLSPLLLGTGSYYMSFSIHDKLNLRGPEGSGTYDLYGRVFNFKILEHPEDSAPMFHQPSQWKVCE